MLSFCFIWFKTFESYETFYSRRLWKNAVTDDDDCFLPQGCHGNDEELEDNSLRIFESFKHDNGRDDIKWHTCTSKRLDFIDVVDMPFVTNAVWAELTLQVFLSCVASFFTCHFW